MTKNEEVKEPVSPATPLPWIAGHKAPAYGGEPVLLKERIGHGDFALAEFQHDKDMKYAEEACNEYPELKQRITALEKALVEITECAKLHLFQFDNGPNTRGQKAILSAARAALKGGK